MPSRRPACAASPRASTRTGEWSSFLSADPPVAVPSPPVAACELFGPKMPEIVKYAQLLVGAGVERGLIGPAEAERIWDRHLLNCGVVAELVPATPSEPAEVRVTLVEPMARRAAFLLEAMAELGLGNVQVRRARAEELAGKIRADFVTSRAVARLDRLAVLAVGLARPGGLVLAIKGAAARQELDRARPVLRRIGATGAEVVSAGAGLLDQPTIVVRFKTRQSAEPGSGEGRGGARGPA